MIIVRNSDGSYCASGDGYDYPIVAEGLTREEARKAFEAQYGHQYAAAQVATARSEAHMEKNRHDYEQMAREAHAYKGKF